jgi:hypothetical protein
VGFDDREPVLVVHAVEWRVARDAGVMDHGVNATACREGQGGDVAATWVVSDGVVGGDCAASGGDDFVDDVVSGAVAGAGAVGRAAIVVHHYQRAAAAEFEGIATAQAVARSGDDNDLVVETNVDVDLLKLGSGMRVPLSSDESFAARGPRSVRRAHRDVHGPRARGQLGDLSRLALAVEAAQAGFAFDAKAVEHVGDEVVLADEDWHLDELALVEVCGQQRPRVVTDAGIGV